MNDSMHTALMKLRLSGLAQALDVRLQEATSCHLSLEMPPAVITSKPARRLLSGIPHAFASPQATASAGAGSLALRLRSR